MGSLTQERLEREFKATEKAIKNARISVDKDHRDYAHAIKFLDTAQRYYHDAIFFKKNNDRASAFGALNYAFGWLDAGKEIGLLETT